MEFSFPDVWEAIAAAIPDREMHRLARSAPHLRAASPSARAGSANYLRRPRARRAPRAERARGLGVRPGPRRALPVQRQRVPRGHARRVQGARRAVQRELPLRRRGARLPAPRRAARARSSTTPRSRRRWPGFCATLPELEVLIQVDDDSGERAAARRGRLRGGARGVVAGSARGRAPSPDDLYILYTGGTTGMPKGVLWRQADIFVAALGGRGRTAASRLARGDRRSRATAGGTAAAAGAAVHARRRALGRVHHADTGRHAWCSRTTSTRLDPDDVLAPIEREKVQRPARSSATRSRGRCSTSSRKQRYDLSSLFVLGQRRRARSTRASRRSSSSSCRT